MKKKKFKKIIVKCNFCGEQFDSVKNGKIHHKKMHGKLPLIPEFTVFDWR